jgi:hypothetical protein
LRGEDQEHEGGALNWLKGGRNEADRSVEVTIELTRMNMARRLDDGERRGQLGPEVVGFTESIEEQHGVALVLVEDGAGRTRLEAGHRCGGALAVKKTACTTRRSEPGLNTASGMPRDSTATRRVVWGKQLRGHGA